MEDPITHLKWFVGIVFLLFIVWVSTGGPERFISQSGPYLKPPTIEEEAAGYGELGIPNVSLRNGGEENNNEGQDSEQISGPTNYKDKIKIGRGNAKSEDYGNAEYIILRNVSDEAIDITGWKLQNEGSLFGGQRTVTIPQGTYLFDPAGSVVTNIILEPGEEAVVLSGEITRTRPINIDVSFKVNKCSGYLDKLENYEFSPSLSTRCPLLVDEPELATANNSCYEAIESIGRCVTPDEIERNDDGEWEIDGREVSLHSACRNFIEEHANYKSCIQRHAIDEDFFQDEWRIFLGTGQLWNRNRETISLYDNFGRLVQRISY